MYRENHAEDTWDKAIAFLDRHLEAYPPHKA